MLGLKLNRDSKRGHRYVRKPCVAVMIPTPRIYRRADSRLAPSQWETSLRSNAVSHWLGASLESSLYRPHPHSCSRENMSTQVTATAPPHTACPPTGPHPPPRVACQVVVIPNPPVVWTCAWQAGWYVISGTDSQPPPLLPRPSSATVS